MFILNLHFLKTYNFIIINSKLIGYYFLLFIDNYVEYFSLYYLLRLIS